VDRIPDLETGQIDLEMIGNGVGRAAHRNFVAHHVEHAAALQARRGSLIQEAHRHIDGHERVLAEPQQIDMNGKIAHRIVLHRARNDASLRALHVKHEDGALEMAGLELLRDRPVFHRDRLGILLVPVNDAGNAAFAARGARAALAGAGPRPALEFDRLSHTEPPKLLKQ
jgi:hypothetical protein